MKQSFKCISVLALLIICSGSQAKQLMNNQADKLIQVDVTKKYPKLELNLQGIATVEYIPLETTKNFLVNGKPEYIDNEWIIYRNFEKGGDILLFNRKGKGIRKINRRGQSGEEYSGISNLVVDKINQELYVSDMWMKKIFVYDWNGKHKRSFWHVGGLQYSEMINFDKDHLFCYTSDHCKGNPLLLISKKDGKKIEAITIPFRERLAAVIEEPDGGAYFFKIYPFILNGSVFIINEISSDTIHKYSNKKLLPYIVRKPNILGMNPHVLLYATLETNLYQFMLTIKKAVEIKGKKATVPSAGLLFDKKTRMISEYMLYNDDYLNKKGISLTEDSGNKLQAVNQSYHSISADKLVEAYQKGELRGELKEIASKLKEDDNPVLMIVKFKE